MLNGKMLVKNQINDSCTKYKYIFTFSKHSRTFQTNIFYYFFQYKYKIVKYAKRLISNNKTLA